MENERDTVAISALKEDLQDVLIEYQVSIQKAGTTVGPLKLYFLDRWHNSRQFATRTLGRWQVTELVL